MLSRRLKIYFLCALLLTGLTTFMEGCGKSGEDKLVIAVVPKGLADIFWQAVLAGATTAAKEIDVEISWNGPATQTMKEQQISIVGDCIVKQVDGIVLAPQDEDALVGVVEDAYAADIPVVIFDSGINTDNYVSFAATDNYQGGVLAADEMARLLDGKGTCIIVKNAPGGNSTLERERGFEETLAKKYPGLKVLDAQFGYSTREKSRAAAEDMLIKHPNVDAIFGSCGPSTEGGLLALGSEQAGSKIFIGFDSSETLKQALREKKIHALVLQDPFRMGYEGVKACVAHINGEKVPKRIDTGVYLVTPDNMNEKKNQLLLLPDLSILN